MNSFYILKSLSAMAPTAQYGRETGNQHFTRPSFPLQGWLCWTNDMPTVGPPNPVKMVTHVFGDHGLKSNHHFTLAAFNLWLNRQVTEYSYNCSRLKKMVIVSDGCAGQNWSHHVFGHLVRSINNMKICPGRFFPNLKELIVLKTVAGHGMIYITLFFLIRSKVKVSWTANSPIRRVLFATRASMEQASVLPPRTQPLDSEPHQP